MDTNTTIFIIQLIGCFVFGLFYGIFLGTFELLSWDDVEEIIISILILFIPNLVVSYGLSFILHLLIK